MAVIYMKFEGIDGKVTTTGFEKMIEVDDIGFGIGRGISSATPGNQSNREASTPSFSEINITKVTDETSPKFFTEACMGKAKKVEFHFVHTGEKVAEYFSIVLTDVVVSGYSLNASGGSSHPSESISLNFSSIVVKYTPYNDKHEAGSPIPAGYDLIKAQKI